MDILKTFDKSGREPRPVQIEALTFLMDTWSTKIVGLNIPVGGGKTAIARAIQENVRDTLYCVSSNALMGQVTTEYPHLNALKGATHYKCTQFSSGDITCEDAGTLLEGKRCGECPYVKAKLTCLNREISVVNPYSFQYLKYAKAYKPFAVLIIDEAHTLISMLLDFASVTQRITIQPKSLKPADVVTWLKDEAEQLKQTATLSEEAEKIKLSVRANKLIGISNLLQKEPHLYSLTKENGRVRVSPIKVPQAVKSKFFDANKVILMSASLNRQDMLELFGDRGYEFFEPTIEAIPVTNRRIYLDFCQVKMNRDTPAKYIAAWIKGQLKKYPNKNTLIHLSYADAAKLKEFFPEAITHDKFNKVEKIELFKKEGGIFLASGMAEGIDLPGDECRLNLIPKILKPNLGDPVIKKRMALDDGQSWYTVKVMTTLQQMAGRSTRGANDFSITVIGDPNFNWMFARVKRLLPKSFTDAITQLR